MAIYSVTYSVGGVAKAISPHWNEEREFLRAKLEACVRLCRELEEAGLLRVVNLPQSGDYVKRALVLELPEPVLEDYTDYHARHRA
jgi:hypothetical protein